MNKIMNQDEIARLPHDELENRYQNLISYIERERRKGRLHPDLEIDSCYLFRELHHRVIVANNHRIFLQNFAKKGVQANPN